jgi:hypothetical protein
MEINPHQLTETEHGLHIIFDTPYGRGMGYWMSDAIDISKQYSVEWTIDAHFILGQNLFLIEEELFYISTHDQLNHIQGRIIKDQDAHLLAIGTAKIMIDLDCDFADQWVLIIVPATRLKIYACDY